MKLQKCDEEKLEALKLCIEYVDKEFKSYSAKEKLKFTELLCNEGFGFATIWNKTKQNQK
jgi:hypothetical protein